MISASAGVAAVSTSYPDAFNILSAIILTDISSSTNKIVSSAVFDIFF
jgi:hypothetical protein